VTPPLLSVVIPVHDAAPWIEELLDSVLDQDVPSMEVIVVDDRSSDGTAHIVDTIGRRDPRLRRLASTAPGGAAARNTGAAAARGEFLVFADADDLVPSGAYRSMVDALQRSGSDLAVGDHLKFSPTATWSPTKRWYSFDAALRGTTISATPGLLTGRACWNRVFRRSFWEREELRFPDVGHADDIVPMTQAMVRARSIDVVPGCVYLYRERVGGPSGSMSNRTDEAAVLDYLREETACVRLVATAAPELLGLQSMLVLDADGWVHLDRYLAELPMGTGLPGAVQDALTALLSALDTSVLDSVAPERRCLFALVWAGEYGAAAAFARAVRRREDDPEAFLRGWVDALTTLGHASVPIEWDRDALVAQGVVPALLHHADRVATSALAPVVDDLAGQVGRPPVDPSSELLRAVHRALVATDAGALRLVSALRRSAPIVVDRAEADTDSLVVGGVAPADELTGAMRLVLAAGSTVVELDPVSAAGRWSAAIPAAALGPGRWTVRAAFRLSTIQVTVPVVTARMPLPPLDERHRLQPLSDRRDGWRFLIDRRPDRSVLARVRSAVGRVRRSRT
jgi:hypothetical protein